MELSAVCFPQKIICSDYTSFLASAQDFVSCGSPLAKIVTHRAFRCETCGAAFVRDDSLRCHRKQHSDHGENQSSGLVTFPPESSAPGQLGALVSVGQLEAPLESSQCL